MSPTIVIFALAVADLVLIAVVFCAVWIACDQRGQLKQLADDRDTARRFAETCRADFQSVLAANFGLKDELHEITVRCAQAEQVIERFIPDSAKDVS